MGAPDGRRDARQRRLDSGAYVVFGALVPVELDRGRDLGEYLERAAGYGTGSGSNLRRMKEILGPLRAAAIAAFIVGVAVLVLDPPSFSGVPDLLTLLVGAAAFVL